MSDIIEINTYETVENIEISVFPTYNEININRVNQTGLVYSVNGQIGDVIIDTNEQVNSDWNATSGVAQILNKPTIPDTANLVPYSGATQNVNLGEFGAKTGHLEFDTTPTNAPTTVGSLVWNDIDGTLDLKLKGGAVTLQIGQETLARIVNKTSTNITLLESNYQAVRITGAQGQRPKVDLALANNDLNSASTLGLVTETILNNNEGFVTTSGQVREINTTGSLQGETWADGDVLYLSGTIAGQITNVKPFAPIHTIIIGFVEYAHAVHGKIFVKIDNGYELNELHNVDAILPNNNEALIYNETSNLWTPKSIIDVLGFTPQKTIIRDLIQKTTITGVTIETLVATYLIPANTFASNDIMRINSFIAEKTGIAGTFTMRVKIGASATFSSAVLIGTSSATLVSQYYGMLIRNSLVIRNGNIKGMGFTSNANNDIALVNNAVPSSTTFNPAIDNYIFTSVQLSNALDSVFQSNFIITN